MLYLWQSLYLICWFVYLLLYFIWVSTRLSSDIGNVTKTSEATRLPDMLWSCFNYLWQSLYLICWLVYLLLYFISVSTRLSSDIGNVTKTSEVTHLPDMLWSCFTCDNHFALSVGWFICSCTLFVFPLVCRRTEAMSPKLAKRPIYLTCCNHALPVTVTLLDLLVGLFVTVFYLGFHSSVVGYRQCRQN